MPRGRRAFGPKDPFAELPTDWKDAVAQDTTEGINKRIAEVAKATEELESAKVKDQDYQEKKEALKEAGAVYREGKKANRLKTLYCIRVLKDRGAA